VYLAFLHPSTRCGILDAHLDDVPNMRVASLGAAKHLNAHHLPSAGVIGDIEHCLHLDHCNLQLDSPAVKTADGGQFWIPCGRTATPVERPDASGESIIMTGSTSLRNLPQRSQSSKLGVLDQALDAPCLRLRELAASLDLDKIARLVLVLLVVRVVLARARHHFAVQRMLDPALDQDRHRLVHFVADDATDLPLDELTLAGTFCVGG